MLKLDSLTAFTGVIDNFTGNGSLSGSDQIDLKGINFNSVHDSYSNGVLTVTDGTNTATLDFSGAYSLANFKFASDGSGGTIVYDPPVPAQLQSPGATGHTPGNNAAGFFGGAGRDSFPISIRRPIPTRQTSRPPRTTCRSITRHSPLATTPRLKRTRIHSPARQSTMQRMRRSGSRIIATSTLSKI